MRSRLEGTVTSIERGDIGQLRAIEIRLANGTTLTVESRVGSFESFTEGMNVDIELMGP